MNHRKTNQSFVKSSSNTKPTSGQTGSNVALTAVAFQDHLMRNLSLADPFRKSRSHQAPPHKRQLRAVRPVVDAGRRQEVRAGEASATSAPKTKTTTKEVEFVLDKKPKPLTLAQKLGLIEAPDQPLSDLDWRDAKERSNRREDSSLPCVICKEEFGLEQQVLLSCSHVFHRNCLQAFERFTGKKTCPMCRREQYQTRVIHEGAKLHRVRCATRIQACWRGYVVHSWYRKLRQTVPPKDRKLRKKFYEEKLGAITERLLRSYDTHVDSFLAEMDRSITASRDVFKNLEASNLRTITPAEWDNIQLKAVERGKSECPICIMPLLQQQYQGSDEGDSVPELPVSHRTSSGAGRTSPRCRGRASSSPDAGPARTPAPRATAGTAATATAPSDRRRRGGGGRAMDDGGAGRGRAGAGDRTPEGQGPTPTDRGSPADGEDGGEASSARRRCAVLLSCTHVFHLACLEAFEELSLAPTKVCPVCRSGYQKKAMPSF